MTEHDLNELLRCLRAVAPEDAGPSVEAQVIQAFRARHPRPKPLWRHWPGVAALLALGAGLYLAWSLLVPPRTAATNRRTPGPQPAGFMTAGFILLPYSQSGVPMEQGVIVRMSIPAATLTSMGMAMPLPPQGTVNAELLVGQDGVARAVRVLR